MIDSVSTEGPGDNSSGPRVGLAEVRAAADRIAGIPVRTPLVGQPEASATLGCELRLKLESLQRTGSFKIRGASHFISFLSEVEVARGVITYSSGNHAQAVALAARLRGIPATVVMPTNAPPVKSRGAEELGARVVYEGTTSVERKRRALEIAETDGLVIVPPFDDPRIISGQGTVGLEIVEDWPEVDTVVVPIGGGGLASGVAAAVRGLKGDARIIGVEPAGAASMKAAFEAGEVVTLSQIDTIADGLAPVRAGELTYRHLMALVDEIVTVSDEAIREATHFLLHRAKLVVEFSGAATLAALLSGVIPVSGRKVAVVVSGGNLDPGLLQTLL